MKYNGHNFEEVLTDHKIWLETGEEKYRADFTDADLSTFSLTGIDFTGAIFTNTNLYNAVLCRSKFINTDFTGANLDGAVANGAIFKDVDLASASLKFTDFTGAILNHVNFKERSLYSTSFIKAQLFYCDFENAELFNVNFHCACLAGVNFQNADIIGVSFICSEIDDCDFTGMIFNTATKSAFNYSTICDSRTQNALHNIISLNCPSEGAFIGWKKVCSAGESCIIKLLIPADAKRLSGTTPKCRTDKAIVLDIQTLDGKSIGTNRVAYSSYDTHFAYEVGNTVTPEKDFDTNRFNECSSGIHFFIDRNEAVNY